MNRRGGLRAMTPIEGMELFDAAVGSGQSLLVPAKLDLRGVRAAAAAGGGVPHMLRGLVPDGHGSWRARWAPATSTGSWPTAWPDSRRRAGRRLLLDLVRAQVAAVLGHAGPEDDVRADTAFKSTSGFDSLRVRGTAEPAARGNRR